MIRLSPNVPGVHRELARGYETKGMMNEAREDKEIAKRLTKEELGQGRIVFQCDEENDTLYIAMLCRL